MHEFVLSGAPAKRELGVRTLDIAKRLLDYGFHPPTIYFPLLVDEALMVEPTETETRESLDELADAFESILAEAEEDPEILRQAPYTTPVRRLDEAAASRKPKIRLAARLRVDQAVACRLPSREVRVRARDRGAGRGVAESARRAARSRATSSRVGWNGSAIASPVATATAAWIAPPTSATRRSPAGTVVESRPASRVRASRSPSVAGLIARGRCSSVMVDIV